MSDSRLVKGMGLMGVDEMMADEVALMEEAELEALASLNEKQDGHQDYMPPVDDMDSLLFEMDEQRPATQGPPSPETPYGSDDDEFDHIFMVVIQEQNRIASQPLHPLVGDQDMMDMS